MEHHRRKSKFQTSQVDGQMVINLADRKEKKMETSLDCGENLEIASSH